MTGRPYVQGQSSSIPGTAIVGSRALCGQIFEVQRSLGRRPICERKDDRLTKTTEQTNIRYQIRSSFLENRESETSSWLRYMYTAEESASVACISSSSPAGYGV